MTEQPNFKWGISTLGCHELDLPAICKLAEQHGIHCLEIRSLADCLNLPEYLDATFPADPAAVGRILDQYHQSIIALNSGFSLIGSGEDARAELLAFACWAEQLKIPFVRVFGGGSMDEPLAQNDLAEAAGNLKWWNEQREKNAWSTNIALETHGGMSSGEEQIGSMVKHVHIKDSVSVPSARHPYSYCLLGEGEFPAGDVFAVLRDNQFDGVVSLEWERKWHPYLPDLDAALESLKNAGWRAASNTSTPV